MPKAIAKKTIERLKILEEKFSHGEYLIVDHNKAAEYLNVKKDAIYTILHTGKRTGYLTFEKQKKNVSKVRILWDKIIKKPNDSYGKTELPSTEELKMRKPKIVEPKKDDNKIVNVNSEPKHITFNGPFGELTTIMDKLDNPWFIAKEVCDKLGYANSRDAISKNVDKEDIVHLRVLKSNSSLRKDTIVINESGLFSLILRSNLPAAKKFKRWVTSEVLPNIRKYGMYASPKTVEELLNNPDTMIKILQRLKAEQDRAKALSKRIEELSIEVEYAEAIALSDGALHIGTWVKSISREHNVVIGRTEAFKWLRNNNYLRPNNEPYQRYIDNGYFETRINKVKMGDVEGLQTTTFITSKGQVKLTPKIIKSFKNTQG